MVESVFTGVYFYIVAVEGTESISASIWKVSEQNLSRPDMVDFSNVIARIL